MDPWLAQWAAPVMLLALGGILWRFAIWLSNEFRKIRELVYDQSEKIMNIFAEKLEYHERHDDTRFQNIQNDMVAIKLRNAMIDGENRKREMDRARRQGTTDEVSS